jgi:SAM-dependent methyltransferase
VGGAGDKSRAAADRAAAGLAAANGADADRPAVDQTAADRPAARAKADQSVADLTGSVRAAYEAEPWSWAAGPEPVYAALAGALAEHVAPLLAGARVLDLGAGTGVAGRAALAAGAAYVAAADVAVGPLRRCRPPLCPVAADAAVLPFRDQGFDVVLAAFSLTHAGRLGAALAESRRVADVLAASAFAPGWGHPAKAAVDAVLARFGYRPPPWYVTFKRDTEPRLGDTRLVRELALAAGYSRVDSSVRTVATGLSGPAELAAWRLGMAHIAPFASSLDIESQEELRGAAAEAVRGCEPLTVSMLVHVAS